jgi:hypothetical protein
MQLQEAHAKQLMPVIREGDTAALEALASAEKAKAAAQDAAAAAKKKQDAAG